MNASIVFFAAGALMIALAALVLAVRPSSPVNATFAGFVGMRGLMNMGDGMNLSGGPLAGFGGPLWVSGVVTVPFLAVVFVLTYRRRKGGRASRWVSLAALAAALAAEFGALTSIDHWGAGDPATQSGPLWAFIGLLMLAYAGAALAFARDYRPEDPVPRRRSALLLAVAFALNPLFAALHTALWYARAAVSTGIDTPAGLGGNIGNAAALAGLVPLALAIGTLRRRAAIVGDADARAWRRARLALAVAAVSSAVALYPAATFDEFLAAYLAVDSVWTLALPLLAGYALLRHQLFDLDVRIKWTISRGTLAAVFLAVFVIAAELAQEYLSNEYDWLVGGVAAGLLVFAITPLQRAAERVASAAVPGARALDDLPPAARLSLYRDQVATAWADGVLGREERVLLSRLRDRLGLAAEEADRVEREVLATPPPGAPL